MWCENINKCNLIEYLLYFYSCNVVALFQNKTEKAMLKDVEGQQSNNIHVSRKNSSSIFQLYHYLIKIAVYAILI